MVTSPRVAIVVLNWNGRRDTLECLESLQALSDPADVIVVDNGSEDASVEAIRRAFPSVDVFETGTNLGYAGGNNVGIGHALRRGAEFILLLNNDTIVAPDLIRSLLGAAKACPGAAFFSPRIYYYADPTTVWYAGAAWDPQTCQFVHLNHGMDEAELANEDLKQVPYACGCALFVRTAAISDVGLLDERFFLTFEEADWCYRAAHAGFQSMYVPEAKVWHKVSASFGGRTSPLMTYYIMRNRLLWASMHLSWRGFARVCHISCAEIVRGRRVAFSAPSISERRSMLARQYYWATLKYMRDVRQFFARPTTRAQLYGIRDFVFRRFGNRHPTIAPLMRDIGRPGC